VVIYVETVLIEAAEKSAVIAEAERVCVYYAEGEDGLSTILNGTIHA
jgi:hypothetical protein